MTTYLIAAASGAMLAAPARSQIPTTFRNLQVLPRDITRDSLFSVMNTFAGGLGVECSYRHAGGNPRTLVSVDFSSDEKATKQRARACWRQPSRATAWTRRQTIGRRRGFSFRTGTPESSRLRASANG
jgi:hypothetical protein